jgi:hypothetical protein
MQKMSAGATILSNIQTIVGNFAAKRAAVWCAEDGPISTNQRPEFAGGQTLCHSRVAPVLRQATLNIAAHAGANVIATTHNRNTRRNCDFKSGWGSRPYHE